ncbi:MAG: glycosyltransferase [Cyclobacteriaceae bacterium]
MNDNLKIALLTPYPPSKTTLNEYGYYLTGHLADKEEISELHILTEDTESAYSAESQKVIFHPCWTFNSLKNPFRIIGKLRKIKPDVVIINQQFLLFGDNKVAAALGLMIPFLLKFTGIKSIVLMHNILEEVDLGQAGISSSKLMQFIYNVIGNVLTRFILSADLVGVTIEKYVDILTDKYHAKNVVLLPHGTFENPAVPEFSHVGGAKQVMAFGKFGTYKRVDVLIEAYHKLKEKGNNTLELVIAGTDSPNAQGYLADVKKKYAHIEGIRFTGYVPEEEVATIFTDSTVVVFPYTSTTGSSGVLHQAGSYGKAVVLPNLGDLGRLIEEEGYTGEYFEPENVESLSDAIEKLIDNDVHREKIARQNYQAATALGLQDISDWYLIHIDRLKMAD